MSPTLPNADELEVVALLKQRDGQTFDGEVHLSSAEAAVIAAQIERLSRERHGSEDETMNEADYLLLEIRAELDRARAKFPASDNLTTIAMFEEAGEVAKAVLSEDPSAVRKECVQLAVMAMRIVLDGDPSTTAYRAKHHQLPPLVMRPEFEE